MAKTVLLTLKRPSSLFKDEECRIQNTNANMFSIDWYGLILPVLYITVLAVSLAVFSSVYRTRKAVQSATLAPWFPPHLQRNIYLSLLHLEPQEGQEKPPVVPESILRAALLRRAVEDIQRIIQIRSQKQACSSLLQRGSVGDDLWQRFLRAEKEMEEELRDVVMEANGLAPNWGNTIFQSANETNANLQFRKKNQEIQEHITREKKWWEERRASIQAEFMKELDEESATKAKSLTSRTTSDEDAVLVEANGTHENQRPGTATSTASGKGKKKGKK